MSSLHDHEIAALLLQLESSVSDEQSHIEPPKSPPKRIKATSKMSSPGPPRADHTKLVIIVPKTVLTSVDQTKNRPAMKRQFVSTNGAESFSKKSRADEESTELITQLPILQTCKNRTTKSAIKRYNTAIVAKDAVSKLRRLTKDAWIHIFVACYEEHGFGKAVIVIKAMHHCGSAFDVHYGGGFIPLEAAQRIVQLGIPCGKCDFEECRRCNDIKPF